MSCIAIIYVLHRLLARAHSLTSHLLYCPAPTIPACRTRLERSQPDREALQLQKAELEAAARARKAEVKADASEKRAEVKRKYSGVSK